MAGNYSQLDYAPPVSGRRLKKWIRWSALIAIVLIAIAFCVPSVMREVESLRLAGLHDKCVRLTLPDVIHSQTPGKSTFVVPPEWQQLNAGMNSAINSGGTMFLDKLRTPSGANEYLVGVDLVSWSRGPTILNLRSRALSRGGHLGPPKYHSATDQTVVLPDSTNKLILHAGTVDPNDRTHFTIRYETDDHKGIIDGWLKDDDSVVIEQRN